MLRLNMAREELDQEAVEAELDQLTRKMERLRVTYEQYFMGIEKMPPAHQQKDVVRILNRLSNANLKKTTHKFRLRSLTQKFSAQKSYWMRTMRQIESGTYRRQVQRARQRDKVRAEQTDVLTTEDYQAINAVRDKMGEDAAREAEAKRRAARTDEGALAEAFMRQLTGGGGSPSPAASPAPAAAAAASPSAGSGKRSADEIRGGMGEEELRKKAAAMRAARERMARGEAPSPNRAPGRPRRTDMPDDAKTRAIYERLVETKRRLNQSTDKLNYDTVRKSLEKQVSKTRAKHNCKSVDFDVVVKNGKAYLKPIPRN